MSVVDDSPDGPVVLHVTSTALDQVGTPLELIDSATPLLFQRRGYGLAGSGQVLRRQFHGPQRFAEAKQWWHDLCSRAHISDSVSRPGTGLVGFGSFSFSEKSSDSSVMVIPQTIFGRDSTGAWQTTISTTHSHTSSTAGHVLDTPKQDLRSKRGPKEFEQLVAQAKAEIARGRLDKVVAAREVILEMGSRPHWRSVLEALAQSYPDTFVFFVDDFFGASPETLGSIRGANLSLRVLAGSAARGDSVDEDNRQSERLMTSSKDLDEHRFAVQSVLRSLGRRDILAAADEVPFALKLPNLWHLATDVMATLPEGFGALDVIEAIHPTAAVAGTPTDIALDFIDTHEGFDRGRYAGPVGWIDSNGDGDWALAVRSARYRSATATLHAYAGAGIVAESDAHLELLETELKLKPVLSHCGFTE